VSSSTGDLVTMLGGNDPVGVVYYRDDEGRDDLLDLCDLLAPAGRDVLPTTSAEDAFRVEHRDKILLLTPDDEVEAVLTLEGRRELLLDRGAPVILFLLQDGEAERALKQGAPALSSFLRGLTYDPEPPVNEAKLEELREDFSGRHGRTADEWLEAWQHDEIEDTADNNLTAHEAWALRKPRAHGMS
jgi:hypothetical protein